MYNYQSLNLTEDLSDLVSDEIKSQVQSLELNDLKLFFEFRNSLLEIFPPLPEDMDAATKSSILSSTLSMVEKTAFLMVTSVKNYLASQQNS